MEIVERPSMPAGNDGAAEGEFTISGLAALCGVSPRTLRFYEERELLRPRRVGNQRLFSIKDRIRLEIIMLGKRLGFSLTEIWDLIESRRIAEEMSAAPSVEALGLSKARIGSQIEHLLRERERVVDAIEELRQAAVRTGLTSGPDVGTPDPTC